MHSLSKNILSTIIYYDILDYPLTSFEIWKYLASFENQKEKYCLGDVVKNLESEEMTRYAEEHQGFYFLKDRKGLAEKRIERNKTSEKKWKIIRRAVFWLRMSPYVRMIAVTGRVAMKNAENKSDLDFFVIFKKDKIFTGRMIFTLLTHLLGKRRYADKITDRICLNYFLSDGFFEINPKDIYSSSEYSFIFPVFGNETFQNFQAKNKWIVDFKPNFSSDSIPNAKIMEDAFFSGIVRKILEVFFSFDFIEKYLREWQMKRIIGDPRTYRKGSAVMASEKALVFLPDPHGPKIYGKFREKMDKLGIFSKGGEAGA